MTNESGLKCVISGSFSKFKPEIDAYIDYFRNLRVDVLAPATGWLLRPKSTLLTPNKDFRPLPMEIDMTPKQVEDEFLSAIARANFLYIVDPGGYIGSSAALEIGFAIARGIPVFSESPISPTLDSDPNWKSGIARIQVLTPPEILSIVSNSN